MRRVIEIPRPQSLGETSKQIHDFINSGSYVDYMSIKAANEMRVLSVKEANPLAEKAFGEIRKNLRRIFVKTKIVNSEEELLRLSDIEALDLLIMGFRINQKKTEVLIVCDDGDQPEIGIFELRKIWRSEDNPLTPGRYELLVVPRPNSIVKPIISHVIK